MKKLVFSNYIIVLVETSSDEKKYVAKAEK